MNYSGESALFICPFTFFIFNSHIVSFGATCVPIPSLLTSVIFMGRVMNRDIPINSSFHSIVHFISYPFSPINQSAPSE